MIAMLRLQFIIFSLIGIGFVTRKKGIVSREGQRSITDLVINVVLPCNIVTSFVQELPDSALRDCVMIFLISVGMEIMCMLYAGIAYRNVEANSGPVIGSEYGTAMQNETACSAIVSSPFFTSPCQALVLQSLEMRFHGIDW